MSGAIPPRPQYAFIAWCSGEAQGQLHLYLCLILMQAAYLTRSSRIISSYLLLFLLLWKRSDEDSFYLVNSFKVHSAALILRMRSAPLRVTNIYLISVKLYFAFYIFHCTAE